MTHSVVGFVRPTMRRQVVLHYSAAVAALAVAVGVAAADVVVAAAVALIVPYPAFSQRCTYFAAAVPDGTILGAVVVGVASAVVVTAVAIAIAALGLSSHLQWHHRLRVPMTQH